MLQLNVIRPEEARQMNPLQLAYMGDVIWSTIIRTRYVCRKLNVHHLHQITVSLVNASAQAQALDSIRQMLTEEENDLVRRGRNAHARHPAPKNQDPAKYADSTAFETLFGFLYITGNLQRIDELTEVILEDVNDA